MSPPAPESLADLTAHELAEEIPRQPSPGRR